MKCYKLVLSLIGTLGLVFSFGESYSQSLISAVHTTLTKNPEVLRRESNTIAAKEAINQAVGGFLPRFDVQVGAGRESTRSPSTNNQQITLNRVETNYVFTQPVFSGFSTYNLVKQRRYEEQSAYYLYRATKDNLALQTTAAYLNVLRLQYIDALTIKNVAAHQETLRKVKLKYTGGAARKTDSDLAQGRLALALSNLKAVENQLKDQKTTYLQVVGVIPKNLSLPRGLPKVPQTLHEAMAIGLKNNPVIKSSLSNFNASEKALAVSKSRLLPSVNIRVSRTNNNNIDGIPGRNKDFEGMVVANYNLLNGGSDRAAIKRAAAIRASAMYNLARVRREVSEDIKQSWDALQTSKQRLKDLRRYVSSSRQVLEGYKEQFNLGKRSLLNVLDLENELYRSSVAYTNGQYSIRLNTYQLLAVTGRLANYFESKKG